jgi:hypothetical protein
VCVLLPLPAEANDPFQQGMVRTSFSFGGASAFGENYLILGMGTGYFLLDGWGIGIDAEVWTGGKYQIMKITPETRYVLPLNSPLRPYIGVFYRKSWISGLPDLESVGGRLGLYYATGNWGYLGFGVVYEVYTDVNDQFHQTDYNTYPEFTISVAF